MHGIIVVVVAVGFAALVEERGVELHACVFRGGYLLFASRLCPVGSCTSGRGGLLEPGVDPSLLDPGAGALSGGHLAMGGMSTAFVEAGL